MFEFSEEDDNFDESIIYNLKGKSKEGFPEDFSFEVIY